VVAAWFSNRTLRCHVRRAGRLFTSFFWRSSGVLLAFFWRAGAILPAAAASRSSGFGGCQALLPRVHMREAAALPLPLIRLPAMGRFR